MKMLITIGSTTILLPDETGVTTIMKVLGKGIGVRDWTFQAKPELKFEGEVRIEMKTVPRGTIVTGLPGKESRRGPKPLALQEPESILL